MITFKRIGASALYRPVSGESYVFLHRETSALPTLIPIADTWADIGEPAHHGHYIFLPSIPSNSPALAAFEANLRTIFPASETTGFGWFDPQGAATNVPVIMVDADTLHVPMIAEDTTVALPQTAMPFAFASGLFILAARESAGKMTGLVMTTPRPDAAQKARGITIELAGPNAGCIHFLGVLESPVTGDSSIKELANVFIDPIESPHNPRSRIEPLDVAYTLSGTESTGYSLIPV